MGCDLQEVQDVIPREEYFWDEQIFKFHCYVFYCYIKFYVWGLW